MSLNPKPAPGRKNVGGNPQAGVVPGVSDIFGDKRASNGADATGLVTGTNVVTELTQSFQAILRMVVIEVAKQDNDVLTAILTNLAGCPDAIDTLVDAVTSDPKLYRPMVNAFIRNEEIVECIKVAANGAPRPRT